ncbi:MAG: cell wall metabolism sensor histidine kinase WalK [Firmicutes bacterium]|nr:cell wall metabolism sensor histidine kinase WalK [Bacillota bacterium]
MGTSIRWRLITVFLLLILIAMELTGVYLLQSLERYYLSSFSETVASQAQLVAAFLQRYMASEPDMQRITQLVNEFGRQTRLDIVVLGPNGALVGASSGNTRELERVLIKSEISRALSGGRGHTVGMAPVTGDRSLHLVEPIRVGEHVSGLVYVIASLEGTYRTLHDVRVILIYTTLLALGVTALLGFIISQTITRPVEEITAKAKRMAAGDFHQSIEVKSGDEIGQLAAMFNHLTGRLKETLAEISGEKAKLEATLTNMADGVIAVDGRGTVIAMNPAAGKMLGVEPESAVGKALENHLPGSADRLRIGDATLVVRRAPIRGDDGDPPGTVIVLQDVTESERLERLRREFVANVSHELKTPLTSVKSYVETLADGALDDPALARQFLAVVGRETDRMTRLVKDLLDLANLDARDMTWDKRPVSVAEAILEAVALVRPQAEKKGIVIESQVHEGLPLVMADYDRLQQVALNILVNAIEYTGSGGRVAVTIGGSRGEVRAVFRDNGIGIPADDLPRIFERFYRVDKARSRELGGTGLGLSIAREIVRAHGGDMAISSEVGRGTEVTLWIPTCEGGPVENP